MEVKRYRTTYTVLVSDKEVQEFSSRWPASNLDEDASYIFEFSNQNGDLLALNAINDGKVRSTEDDDGPALLALSQDAGEFGAVELELQEVLDIRYPTLLPRP